MRHALLWLLLFSSLLTPAGARTKHHRARSSSSNFDFYLLALSWSPEYCHSHGSSPQCAASKHFGFVVHGFWPEYRSGGGPENCSTAPGPSNPSSLLDIMPDLALISHEWKTHGTCSGMDADSYFATIRKAFKSVRIPQQFQSPSASFTTSPSQVASQFSQANNDLPAAAVTLTCPSNFLNDVRICIDKSSLKPIACPIASSCRASSVRVPPVP